MKKVKKEVKVKEAVSEEKIEFILDMTDTNCRNSIESMGFPLIQIFKDKIGDRTGWTLDFEHNTLVYKKEEETVTIKLPNIEEPNPTEEKCLFIFTKPSKKSIDIIKELKELPNLYVSEKEMKKAKLKFKDLVSNPLLFKELNNILTGTDIDLITEKKALKQSESIFSKPTLIFDWTTDYNSPDTIDLTHIQTTYPNISNLFMVKSYLRFYDFEKITDIKAQETTIIKYYRDRNMILSSLNPFSKLDDLIKHATFKSNKSFMQSIETLKNLLTSLNIEKVSKEGFLNIVLISRFKQNLEKEKILAEQDLKENEQTITNLVSQLNDTYHYKEANKLKLEGLNFYKYSSEDMKKEIEEARKLPFVEKVELVDAGIKVTYIETTITDPSFARDNSVEFGPRDFYLGRISITIKPDSFLVEGDCPINDINENNERIASWPHPHANTVGKPCFGSGDAESLIMQLRNSCKFSGLISYLWQWVKTYISKQAHCKSYRMYDDRLIKGLPIFEGNNRIEINEQSRLNSGEQITLVSSNSYNENKTKFAGFKK